MSNTKKVAVRGTAVERQRRRTALFQKQAGLCHWCKKPMTLERVHPPMPQHPDYATFEHIKPRSQGGMDDRDNIVLAHTRCNQARA